MFGHLESTLKTRNEFAGVTPDAQISLQTVRVRRNRVVGGQLQLFWDRGTAALPHSKGGVQ